MCLGRPMQIAAISEDGTLARCCAPNDVAAARNVALTLLEEPPRVGDWVLVHITTAIRALDPTEAEQITNALAAVAAAAADQPFEHLLADLIDREPQLPPHLRPGSPSCEENT